MGNVSLLYLILFLIIKVKRSKKYRNFKEFGLPRYLMINEEDKKRECVKMIFLSVLFLVLTLIGKNEIQRCGGALFLFFINILGDLSK